MRTVEAARREQAAIERARQVIAPVAADPGRAEELYARIRSASARAQALLPAGA